jgi:hypothetical protein
VAVACVGFLAVALAPAAAAGHDGGLGVSEIRIEGTRVDYDLYLDATQLGLALPLGDGEVGLPGASGAPGTRVRRRDVARLVAEGLSVESAGVRGRPRLLAVDATTASALTWLGGVSRMGGLPLLRARVRYEFPAAVREWRIGYALFPHAAGQPPHGNLVWLHEGGRTVTYVFAPGAGPLVPGAGRPVPSPEEAAGRAGDATAPRPGVPAAAIGLALAVLAAAGGAGWAAGLRARSARPTPRRAARTVDLAARAAGRG